MDKIIVAFAHEKSGSRIKEILERGGAASCLLCKTADQVRRVVHLQRIYVVVCGYKLPDASGEELFDDLPDACAMLMIANQVMLDLCGNRDIFKLPSPVSTGNLIASVRMLLQMEHRMERYVRPRWSDEERELIDRAKQLLMTRRGMTEPEAHRFIQRRSMENRTKMIQTVQLILEGV